jgi:hypothetical protein
LGHALRLPEKTPARLALAEAERPERRPRGKPKITWLTNVQRQLEKMGLTWEEAKKLAVDREAWREKCAEERSSCVKSHE